jgi:hypothetical protein
MKEKNMTQRIAVIVYALAVAFNPAYGLKFVAYGDSRDNIATFTAINHLVAAENPALVLHSGDCWGSLTTASWLSAIESDSVTNALLKANLYLVARGNHETFAQLKSVSPTVIRNDSEEYSFTQGNCFFVSCGMNPSANGGYAWLRQQLSSAASQAARWRFIFNHYPIYCTSSTHSADGNTEADGVNVVPYRKLCDTFHVTIAFAGHDHVYERTKLLYDSAVAASGTTFNIGRTPGTVYVVSGGAGAPLYTVGSAWWVGYNLGSTYNYTVVDAEIDTCYFTAKNSAGTVIDQVTIVQNAVGTLPAKVKNSNSAPVTVYSPGNNSFSITGPTGSSYSVFGLSGKFMAGGCLAEAKERITMSGIKKGIYLLKINSLIYKVLLR